MAKITPAADYPIDLTSWFLTEIKDLPDLTRIAYRAASEALRITFAGENNTPTPNVYLPVYWGPNSDGLNEGSPPENPLTVYLRVPLCDPEEEMPTWKFTINELITDVLASTKTRDGWVGEDRGMLKRVRDALIQQADRIDNALNGGSDDEVRKREGWLSDP